MPDRLWWVDTLGAARELPAMPGVQGRGMPRVAWSSKPNATQGGNRLAQVRHAARDLLVPVWVDGDDEDELRAYLALWARVLDPTRGEGVLRSVRPSGLVREIRCIYTGGMEWDESMEALGVTPWSSEDYLVAVLSFQAAEPYWYDPITQGTLIQTGDAPEWFPWPPIKVGSALILQAQTIVNPGDVEAWPVIEARGPFDKVTVENNGKRLVIDAARPLGGFIRVDHRTKTAADDAGLSRYADIARDPASSMWPLAAGTNDLNVTVEGSVAGQTELSVLYQPRYFTP